jgi:integrase
MARLITINYRRRRVQTVTDVSIEWEETSDDIVEDFPQICWEDGKPWAEANLWALHMVDRGKTPATILSAMVGMLTFANWLESSGVQWWHFPDRESDRCLFKFHGALKSMRTAKRFAPSTTAQRMNTALRFYKWVNEKRLITESTAMPEIHAVGVGLPARFGFVDTMKADVIADLSIKHRSISGAIQLEDGVLPVSAVDMVEILRWVQERASQELFLILSIGFWTGLRLGSILDLKVSTITNAVVDSTTGTFRLAVGPSANPPVATKFDMDGYVLIPTLLLRELQGYVTSTRRLLRQGSATETFRHHLFLTRYGSPYNRAKSSAIEVAMHRLKVLAAKEGIDAFRGFYIHRTRATFATELMRVALKHMNIADAVPFVSKALLHADEKSTFGYVHFIRTQGEMVKVFDEFSDNFMGKWVGLKNGQKS